MTKAQIGLRTKENSRIAIEKYWKEGFVPGVSSEEISGLASKLKNRKLVESGRMKEIEREAEVHFRNELYKKDSRLYSVYTSLKEGKIKRREAKQQWREISPLIGDVEIKKRYIERIISPDDSDKELFNEAIEQIIRKRTRISFEKYDKYAKIRGLSKEQKDSFIGLAELVKREASDVLYETRLHDYLTNNILGNQDTQIIYCICLRLTHDFGHPDITLHLKPFNKIDKDGKEQFHSGEAQRYQLEKIIGMSSKVNKFSPHIKQTIMMADFDAHKYGEEAAKRMVPKTRKYLEEISKFVPEIRVVGEIDYMDEIGFDQELYMKVFESILINDGQFFPERDISRELGNCQFHRSRSINNWDDDKSKYYVAASTSRKLTEGIALSQTKENHVMVVFNDNTVAGVRFNYLVKNKIPFVSLPKLGRRLDDPTYW